MNPLGFDVETTKLPSIHPWQKDAQLVALGLTDKKGNKKTWLFNHKDADPAIPQRNLINEIQEMINQADRLVGHNLKFDLNWLNYLGIDYSHCSLWCTLITEYLLESQRLGSLTLFDLSEKYLQVNKIDKVKMFWDAGFETTEIPLDILLPYLEQDCINTLAIYQKQMDRVSDLGMDALVSIENEATRVLSEIECNGMKFNVGKANEYANDFRNKLAGIDTEVKMEVGQDFNISSTDQLSAALYGGSFKVDGTEWVTRELKDSTKYYERKCKVEKKLDGLGFEPIKNTELKKGGVWSTDKNTIKFLKAKTKPQRKIKKLLLERSELQKALETLDGKGDGLKGLINKVQADGCIHGQYNQAVTKTGRLSSKDPNSQNIPRGGTSPIKICIEARFDYIVVVDLSQIEWRVAAWLSQDPTMIKEIEDGVDIHRENAIEIFGADPNDPKFKEIRTNAKIVTFRLLYGGTEYGFYYDQKMPNYPLSTWKKIVDSFYTKYKGLRMWQLGNLNQVPLNNGLLINPTGRRFKFNKRDKGYSHPQICNFPVQSLATADIMPLAMCIIYKAFKKRKFKSLMIGQVHDSIIFDVIKSEAKDIARLCINIFDNLPRYIEKVFGFEFNVPLTGDVEIGLNYGEQKEFKKF